MFLFLDDYYYYYRHTWRLLLSEVQLHPYLSAHRQQQLLSVILRRTSCYVWLATYKGKAFSKFLRTLHIVLPQNNFRRDKKDFKEHRISSVYGEVPEKINFTSQHQHESIIENPPLIKLSRRATEQLTAQGKQRIPCDALQGSLQCLVPRKWENEHKHHLIAWVSVGSMQ